MGASTWYMGSRSASPTAPTQGFRLLTFAFDPPLLCSEGCPITGYLAQVGRNTLTSAYQDVHGGNMAELGPSKDVGKSEDLEAERPEVRQ